MGKVAFLALTYSSFEKEELMKKFFNKEDKNLYNLYIHNKEEIADEYLKKFIIPQEYKTETKWGTYSLILAVINMIKYALLDKDNEKFILISGSHCPLNNIQKTCEIINKKYSKDTFTILGMQPWDSKFEEKFSDEKDNFLLNYKVLYAISQWFIWTRESANIYAKNEEKFRKFFELEKQICTDELYFFLMNKYFKLDFQIKEHSPAEWKIKTDDSLIELGHRPFPRTYSNFSNNLIDEFRQKDYVFFRKVCSKTIIDEDYLLK